MEKKTDLQKTDWQKEETRKFKKEKGPIRISMLIYMYSELIHFRRKLVYDSKLISNFERMLVLKLRENTGDLIIKLILLYLVNYISQLK